MIDYNGSYGGVDKEEGTYVVSNGLLTLYYYDEDESLEIDAYELDIIDGNQIVIGGIMFTKR